MKKEILALVVALLAFPTICFSQTSPDGTKIVAPTNNTLTDASGNLWGFAGPDPAWPLDFFVTVNGQMVQAEGYPAGIFWSMSELLILNNSNLYATDDVYGGGAYQWNGATFDQISSLPSGAPCDIYANGGTPCVAAHSTVRALYSSYNGPLYQVRRAWDNSTQDIGLLSAGGYVNAATQDSFCAGTTCVFTKIYDQSPQENDLTPSVGGLISTISPVNASLLPTTIAGHKAYGVYTQPGQGFSDRSATGTAGSINPGAACTGSVCAEGIYMVTSSNHASDFSSCCYDYGNAERTPTDDGDGTMHAIYWGIGCWITPCAPGTGPWIAYDLENGWFYSDQGYDTNSSDTGVNYTFVTAMSSTDGTATINRKTGNAQAGGLTTWYSGLLPQVSSLVGPGSPCPTCYTPLHLEGGIILGTGGDNSNSVAGIFFEGAMTNGRPSDATDDAIQANVVSAGYTSIP